MKKDEVEIVETTRRTLYCNLEPFDHGFAKKQDFVEIVEWINGGGFDVLVETNNTVRFSLSWGQYDAITHIVEKLNKL